MIGPSGFNIPAGMAGSLSPVQADLPQPENDALPELQNIVRALPTALEDVTFSATLLDLKIQGLLRQLLELPGELQDFLKLFSENKPLETLLSQTWTELLQENPQIPFSLMALQHRLSQQSQASLQKLITLLQRMPDQKNSEQIRVLIQEINSIQSLIKETPMQALQTTIPLYLPWYPLPLPQQFHFKSATHQNKGEKEQSAAENNSTLQIYLQTLMMGRFLIQIGEETAFRLYIHFRTEPVAAAHLQAIEKNIGHALADAGMTQTVFLFQPHTGPNPQDKLKEPEKAPQKMDPAGGEMQSQQYTLSAVGAIQARIVMAAYLVVRCMLEMDNQLVHGPS